MSFCLTAFISRRDGKSYSPQGRQSWTHLLPSLSTVGRRWDHHSPLVSVGINSRVWSRVLCASFLSSVKGKAQLSKDVLRIGECCQQPAKDGHSALPLLCYIVPERKEGTGPWVQPLELSHRLLTQRVLFQSSCVSGWGSKLDELLPIHFVSE